MKPNPSLPDIYQLRIVLRDISPLIWRRLLVRSDTTLAQLHLMIQMLFDWRNEHLHHFHVFGKDYGSDGADTRTVRLHRFGLRHGERFGSVPVMRHRLKRSPTADKRLRLPPSFSSIAPQQ